MKSGEKPMAYSMERARAMVAASEKAGKLYMVSQSRRYDNNIRAFRALMRHLKAQDPAHTVILVQVENESGAWGSGRDY